MGNLLHSTSQYNVMTSDGLSRLGPGLETRLETRYFEVSVSKVSGLVSVSKDFGLFVSRLCIGYFL